MNEITVWSDSEFSRGYVEWLDSLKNSNRQVEFEEYLEYCKKVYADSWVLSRDRSEKGTAGFEPADLHTDTRLRPIACKSWPETQEST